MNSSFNGDTASGSEPRRRVPAYIYTQDRPTRNSVPLQCDRRCSLSSATTRTRCFSSRTAITRQSSFRSCVLPIPRPAIAHFLTSAERLRRGCGAYVLHSTIRDSVDMALAPSPPIRCLKSVYYRERGRASAKCIAAWTPSDSLDRLTKCAELEKVYKAFKFVKITGTYRRVQSSSLKSVKSAKIPSSGCSGSPNTAPGWFDVGYSLSLKGT